MLLRNFKSSADEVTKRNLANELLKVEIENEGILEQRIGDYKNPNAPPRVPPVYKSNAELMKDTILQEKNAIDNLLSLDFDYNDAVKIVKWMGDKNLAKFNQGFPFIKSDIQKKFNPRLVDVSFMEGYLEKYFDDVAISFGFAFNRDNDIVINSLSELKDILPSQPMLENLLSLIHTIGDIHIGGETMEAINQQITMLRNAILTDSEVALISQMPILQRTEILKKLAQAVRMANIPRPKEISELEIKLQKSQNQPQSIESLGLNILRRFSGYDYKKLKVFEEIKQYIRDSSPNLEPEVVENLPIEEGIPVSIKNRQEIKLDKVLTSIYQQLNEPELNEPYSLLKMAIEIMDIAGQKNIAQYLRADIKKEFDRYARAKESNNPVKKPKLELLQDVKAGLKDIIEQLLQQQIIDNPDKPYIMEAKQIYKNEDHPSFGFGMSKAKKQSVKALKNHFKEDEKFLKKVSKKIQESDSSSDEELMEELSRHKKAEKPYESKIEKAVGAGYIHKRIPVKKIVGKGIEVQEQPTYKTFGKYVMHIPHLLNNNVLNLKYPSLGSIPSIKPLTVSEDYKDFVIDVMNTGRVNEKAYSQLEPHEKKHFEKVCKGAGLMDTFKLKKSVDDEDKADEARFNLLRGNYLGGNNSESVVKELKALVVKFINDGRIHRNEGYNLLMELSII